MKAHAKNLRKGRLSRPNQVYLATIVTKDRNPVFEELALARIAARCLNAAPHATTLAYVVMPDHIHWLMELRGRTLSKVIQGAKVACTKRVNRLTGRKGALWQPGFHDHAVRREEALRDLARYIISNPVRAGIVESVRDYAHWDAIWI